MYASQIEPGMCLRLKRSRMNDYGLDSPYVYVSGIKTHPRYRTPWIMSGNDAFKPSDFERQVNPADTELTAAIERKSRNQMEEN